MEYPSGVVTLKFFDTYGPADRRPKLLNLLLAAAATQVPLAVSPGQQMIDLVHVDDAVGACLAVARPFTGPAGWEHTIGTTQTSAQPRVMVEPAPMVAPAPICTGATSEELLPTKAPSPITVWCLLNPS